MRGSRFGLDVRWSLALLGVLTLALASCDGHRVVEPPFNGVVWTRLTPAGVDDCLWPEVLDDSLTYSFVGLVPVGGGNFTLQGRIAVSGVDGQDPFFVGFPGSAPWNQLRPRWAGRQLVIVQDNRSGNYDLWYRDFDDLSERRLTNFAGHETAPAPRPSSPGLVYVQLRTGATNAYDFGRIVLIPDTASVPLQLVYLTPDTLLCTDPSWDPSGTKLCFTVLNGQDQTRHVYTMNLAPGDSVPVQTTVGYTHDYHPRWSPDGGHIVYTSDRTGRWGVWVVHPSGEAQGLKLVSFDDYGASCFSPTWLPDQTGIIVSSNGRGGTRALWLLSNLPAFGF